MLFRTLRCSFCCRKSADVNKLVAGARGYICDRCAHEVIRIMNDAPATTDTWSAREAVELPSTAEWNRTWHFTIAECGVRNAEC
jgi:ATP-dependent protease Clp ATPase subunit